MTHTQTDSVVCFLDTMGVIPYSGQLYLTHNGTSTFEQGVERPFHPLVSHIKVEVDRPDTGSSYRVEFLTFDQHREFGWVELEAGQKSRVVPMSMSLPKGPFQARVIRMMGGDMLSAFTSMTVTLYGDVSAALKGPEQLEPLVKALEAVPSLTILKSCCGHGREPYTVLFRCMDPRDLEMLVRCLGPDSKFVCELHSPLPTPVSPLTFRLVSRTDTNRLIGEPAYTAAAELAAAVTKAENYQACVRKLMADEQADLEAELARARKGFEP